MVARALCGTALFSALSGAVLVPGASDWRRHFGLASPWLVAAVGGALLAFAPTTYQAGQTDRFAAATYWSSAAWTWAGSPATRPCSSPTPALVATAGRWAVGLTAAVVALFSPTAAQRTPPRTPDTRLNT